MSKVNNSIEPRSFARKTIEYEHAEIHEGNAYDADIEFSLIGTASTYYLIQTGSNYIHFKDFSFTTDKSEVKIFLYQQPTATGTSSVEVFNADDDSTKLTTLQLFSSPTVSNEGTKRKVYYESGLTSTADAKGRGDTVQPLTWEYILKKNSKYLIKLVRLVTDGDTKGVLKIRYYEER